MRSLRSHLPGFVAGLIVASAVLSTAALITADASESQPATGWVRSLADTPTKQTPNGRATIRLLAGADDGASGAFLGVLEIEPGAGVPQHTDATAEFVYFLEGGGTITLAGTQHPVTAGDTVYMPPGLEVSFQNGDVPSKVVQVFAPQGPEAKYDGWVSAP